MSGKHRTSGGGTGYGSGLWPVLLSLLVVLIPTACVLWFLNEAVQNERLAAFAACVGRGLADSVVCYDASGRLSYPAPPRPPASLPTESVEWADAGLLEHTRNEVCRRIRAQGLEMPIVMYFLKRPERALTRKDILDAVWGRSVIVTGRSVDRCVTTLRAKIEPDPRRPLHIQTIRDIGYRFRMGEPDASV